MVLKKKPATPEKKEAEQKVRYTYELKMADGSEKNGEVKSASHKETEKHLITTFPNAISLTYKREGQTIEQTAAFDVEREKQQADIRAKKAEKQAKLDEATAKAGQARIRAV